MQNKTYCENFNWYFISLQWEFNKAYHEIYIYNIVSINNNDNNNIQYV